MTETAHQITTNHITTDDLAFSAYLKTKGYRLIKYHHHGSKTVFTFSIDDDGEGPRDGEGPQGGEGLQEGQRSRDGERLKVEFINSPFSQYYNELRNLKKIL